MVMLYSSQTMDKKIYHPTKCSNLDLKYSNKHDTMTSMSCFHIISHLAPETHTATTLDYSTGSTIEQNKPRLRTAKWYNKIKKKDFKKKKGKSDPSSITEVKINTNNTQINIQIKYK